MATKKWIGASLNKKQVSLITTTGAGNWVGGDIITLTIDSIDFVITVGTLVTDDQVALTIQQALSGTTLTDTALVTIPVADGGASLIPQFAEFTATVATNVVSLTANQAGALAGKPFTITSAVTVAGDETANVSASITPTSQYHADQADNYSANGVPTGGSDTLIFDNGSVDVRWGLDYATTLTNITKYKSYTGNVGLSEVNTDNTAKPYHEYRTTYLTCTACTTVNLEVGDGPGSGRFKLNTGSAAASAINIFGRGNRLEQGVPAILWKGTHASNTVNNVAGDLGVAFFGGEVATILTLTTGDGPVSNASTVCGSGVTLGTVNMNGGNQETNSAITAAVQNGGKWVHKLGTVTALTVNGEGIFYPVGAATITTLTLNGGTLDCTTGNASFVVTNTVTMTKGSKYLDPNGRTGNPVFLLSGCTLADVTIKTKPGKTITFS